MTSLPQMVADGRQVAVLTRDDITEALKEYGRLYGDAFPQSAFSPSQAKRNGRPELVELYYKGRPDGRRWPSLNAIKSKFDGSWNDARAAAGFAPNSTGPMSGRRRPGDAEPILNVRERIVYLPPAKTKEAVERARRLEARLGNALARAERAERRVAELRSRPVRVVRDPPVKTKTVTKTVKVKDARALERLRARLADSEAARRAIEDQLKSAIKDRSRAETAAANARSEAAALAVEAREALAVSNRASDRLAAAQARAERLAQELADERERVLGVSEAAVASEMVRQAEARVEEAEVRAARAERQMAEQSAAITGEMRRLTLVELAELRSRGPAGRAVLEKAIKKLMVALARGGNEPLRVALTELAQAAVGWRDRL